MSTDPHRGTGTASAAATATATACAMARVVSGILATGVALAVGHAIAAAIDSSASPILAVADSVVDRAPAPVREATIDALGTADKPALLIGLAVILLLSGALAGLVERSRRPAGSVLIAVLGLVGALAAVARPNAGPAWALPAIAGAAAGVLMLRLLTRALDPASSGSAST